MKILHVSPNSPYNIGWGFQENLLPKYQARLGYDVTVIVTNLENSKMDKFVEVKEERLILEDNVKLIRKKNNKIIRLFKKQVFQYMSIKEELEEIKPDFIFVHGLGSFTILSIVKYIKKNPHVKMVQDNHLDFKIGKNDTFKLKFFAIVYKLLNKYSQRYAKKIYGVNPTRVLYAKKVFGIKENKLDCLIQGADDDYVHLDEKIKYRNELNDKFSFTKEDFVICTGGKLNENKGIIELMEASSNLKNVKLVIFGTISDSVKIKFEEIMKKSNNIFFIGWISSELTYKYFLSVDLIVFPGQHSVLWEQACACKVPVLLKNYDNLTYCNVNDNVEFLETSTSTEIREKILSLQFTNRYRELKQGAESKETDCFLYSNIAKKSVEVMETSK